MITAKVDPKSAEKVLLPVPDYIIETRYNFFEAKRQSKRIIWIKKNRSHWNTQTVKTVIDWIAVNGKR